MTYKQVRELEKVYDDYPKWLSQKIKPCICGCMPEYKSIWYKVPQMDFFYYECPKCGRRGDGLSTNKKYAKIQWNSRLRKWGFGL